MAKIHASVISVSVKNDEVGQSSLDLQDVLKKYEEYFILLNERVKQLEMAYIEQQLLIKREE